jgi:hypothetical protein
MKRLNITDEQAVVIVNASAVSRTYWAGEYDANAPRAPTCWSVDTHVPSSSVPEKNRQATRCLECPHDIRGSGANGGRACRFSQKLAVVLEADIEHDPVEVYQLHVPASSIFSKKNTPPWMGLQEYAKFLAAHDTNSVALLTRISKSEGDIPKLLFAPKRPLEEAELDVVKNIISAAVTLEAINTDAYIGNDNISPFEELDGYTQTNLENEHGR